MLKRWNEARSRLEGVRLKSNALRGLRSALGVLIAASPWGAAFLLGSCGLMEGYRRCADVDPLRSARLPSRLSETGLFRDVSTGALASGVRAYRPTFELWSDGATKRRWIWLPANERIDSSDMDSWSFPVGTKLWKEFTRDGVRVETRLLQRIGPGAGDWAAVAYLWNAERTEAVAVPDGVENARGTAHDVPAAGACSGCHGGRASRVLGFSAVQLSGQTAPGTLDLEELVRQGALTAPPTESRALRGSTETIAALGYLHANCSHCHNQQRPPRDHDGFRCFDPETTLDFSLQWGQLGPPEATATYRTALQSAVKPGHPDDSLLIERVRGRKRFPPCMPPLATKRVDDHAVELLSRWISSL